MENARADLIAVDAALLVINELRQMSSMRFMLALRVGYCFHPRGIRRVPNKERPADRGSTNEYRVVIDKRDPLVVARCFVDQALQVRPADSWPPDAVCCFIHEQGVIESQRGVSVAWAHPDPSSPFPIADPCAEHIFGDGFRSAAEYRWTQ
jgi:hypothetical protein